MGNKLYIDSNVSNITDLLNFDLHNLQGNITTTDNYNNLKIWQFYETDDEKLQSRPVHMPSIKEEKFLLSNQEVYIILLVYKEEISEMSAFPSSLWGIVESSSNMTPRGLKYAFSTSNEKAQNLESYLLSKRNFKDSEYKYLLFIWNGKNSSALLKSEALMRAFDLDKKLSDPSILPYLYSGHYISDNKLLKGTTTNLNAIINNTIEHVSDVPLTPSTETFMNTYETVYLLQWLYPINDIKQPEKNKSEKSINNLLFNKFNKAFLNDSKTDYFKGFVALETDVVVGLTKKDSAPIDSKAEEDAKDDSYEDNDTSSLVDEDIVPQRTDAKQPSIKSGFNLGLGNLENLKKDGNLNNNNKITTKEEPKVPRLSMSIQQRFVNEETITSRIRQNIEEEEKMDNVPPQTIKKVSDEVSRNRLGLRINVNKQKEEPKYVATDLFEDDSEISSNSKRSEESEDDYVQESERKEVLMDFYNKNISIIIDGFLYLSGYNVAKNKDIIDANRITHIVNAATDVCQNHFEEKIKYINYNLKDHSSEVNLKII
jgi:hypothetical protein